MTTLFSDNFNRADNATVDATNWVENASGNWDISSNTLRSASAGQIIATTSAHAAVADCKATITLANPVTGFDGGPMARCSTTDGQNGYFLDYDKGASTLAVWRRVSGVDTQIGADITSFSAVATDTLTLEVSGSGATVTLKAYKNGVQQGSNFSDSAGSRITAAGQSGIVLFAGTNATLDNFLLEDLAGGGSATITPTAGSLAITGQTPGVSNSGNGSVSLAPSAGSLGITGQQPTMTLTVAAAGVGALAFSGLAPSLLINNLVSPVAGALAFTGRTSSVANSGGSQSIAPGVGSLSFNSLSANLANSGSVGALDSVIIIMRRRRRRQ